jgi:hypothetical protein
MTPLSFLKTTVFAQVCFGILFLLPPLAWSQMDATIAEPDNGALEDAPLQAPPPVSGVAYSTSFTSETGSNYLRGGFTTTGAYSNNITGIETSNPAGGASFSIWTMLELNKSTSRGHYLVSYSPGYTFYPSASTLNQPNQNANVDLHYRLSPNATVSVRETFLQTSNIVTQSNPLSAIVVSGSAPSPSQAIVPAVADQLSNCADAQLIYQIDSGSMLGMNGTFGDLRFPNPTQATGLYNSNSAGGSVFYSRSLYDRYQFGANYLYQILGSYPVGTQSSTGTRTQTQSVFLFLSISLKQTLSLSFSAGPQHATSAQGALPVAQSWSPLTMASIGWRGGRTSLAASYARIVTSAGGLNGAYHSNSATGSARWQVNRTWTGGISASYANYKPLTPFFVMASSGGNTLSATAAIEHSMGEHLRAQAGYSWARQNYNGSTDVGNLPNIDRAFVSISYEFTRPLQ